MVVGANRTRKDFAADEATQMVTAQVYTGVRRPLVGVYRLTMKSGLDDFRVSSIQGIMKRVKAMGQLVLSPAPARVGQHVVGRFKRRADVILANRWSDELSDVGEGPHRESIPEGLRPTTRTRTRA